jgi:hypothetical protein
MLISLSRIQVNGVIAMQRTALVAVGFGTV